LVVSAWGLHWGIYTNTRATTNGGGARADNLLPAPAGIAAASAVMEPS
jgi:hypothetical protein